MDSTPRLRSAFPATPKGRQTQNGAPTPGSRLSSPTKPAAKVTPPAEPLDPVIPSDVLDPATQRLYAAAIYCALLAWRFWDFYVAATEESESLWLFMKWVSIDGIFLFALPSLRIPWLEWSSTMTTGLFLIHALLNGMLVFRVGIPYQILLAVIQKAVYDRETAISERRVKPADIHFNSSVILGRQIINVLPDGSAFINPEQRSFCVGSGVPSVNVPITVNQTIPKAIELLRIDIDDPNVKEVLSIPQSSLRSLRKEVERAGKTDAASPKQLTYTVNKPGYYTLHKVLDNMNVEVSLRHSEATVVKCPYAEVKSTAANKCKGELSDVDLVVHGVPPMKVKYRKTVNGIEREATFHSVQPDDYNGPLVKQNSALAMKNQTDLSWAQTATKNVPLIEHLSTSGDWVYTIEQVIDALGNVKKYDREESDNSRKRKSPEIYQGFHVHERPTAYLDGCDLQHPIRVSRDWPAPFPVKIQSGAAKGGSPDQDYDIEYLFTPAENLSPSGDHGAGAELLRSKLSNRSKGPGIRGAGLYTLKSVASPFCDGDILEPASCMLQYAPEPTMSFTADAISGRCAGNPVGLDVNLNFAGTPPFEVEYTVTRDNDKPRTFMEKFKSLRGNMRFQPSEAGHYTYTFTKVQDELYIGIKLRKEDYTIEQDVRPSASAGFIQESVKSRACISQSTSFDVWLQGEPPFSLSYDIVHNGKRKPVTIKGIESRRHSIETAAFHEGGDYSIVLQSITDKGGCPSQLQAEIKINVRQQRPRAAFGELEGSRDYKTLEAQSVGLPLRLGGERPFYVKYRRVDDGVGEIKEARVDSSNGKLTVNSPGTYELVDVRDATCPGSVHETANRFRVDWVPRPQFSVSPSSATEEQPRRWVKEDICEGEDDALELHLTGKAPFELQYKRRHKPLHGSESIHSVPVQGALNSVSIPMDTMNAGTNEYTFVKLEDYNYNHDSRNFQPFQVSQRVHPRPDAHFTKTQKAHERFYQCVHPHSAAPRLSNKANDIQVTLTGQPPFTLDIDIKPDGSSKAASHTLSSINAHIYILEILPQWLAPGESTIFLTRIRDARGCSRRIAPNLANARIKLSAHDPPSIASTEPEREHYCVGDHLLFNLNGRPGFLVDYSFNGQEKRASIKTGHVMRRIAEFPGTMAVNAVEDNEGRCRATAGIEKTIHGIPTVRVSQGKTSRVDIHEGDEAEIAFEFTGEPPFEFTFTRSVRDAAGRLEVKERKTLRSEAYAMHVKENREGVYEVVAIRDRWCSYPRDGMEERSNKLLTY